MCKQFFLQKTSHCSGESRNFGKGFLLVVYPRCRGLGEQPSVAEEVLLLKVYNLNIFLVDNFKLWLATSSCSNRLLATFNNGIIILISIITLVATLFMFISLTYASSNSLFMHTSGVSAKHANIGVASTSPTIF